MTLNYLLRLIISYLDSWKILFWYISSIYNLIFHKFANSTTISGLDNPAMGVTKSERESPLKSSLSAFSFCFPFTFTYSIISGLVNTTMEFSQFVLQVNVLEEIWTKWSQIIIFHGLHFNESQINSNSNLTWRIDIICNQIIFLQSPKHFPFPQHFYNLRS